LLHTVPVIIVPLDSTSGTARFSVSGTCS